MKRNEFFILILFLVVVTNYSLMSYAEDQNKVEKEGNIQVVADTLEKPLSVFAVNAGINEKTRTSTQISEYRKSAYGKYVEGSGIVTDVIREQASIKYKKGNYVNTLLIYVGDKKDAKKGFFHVKMATEMDTSTISLFQNIKFKGKFGRSTGKTTSEYVHLYNGEFELLN